MSREILERRYRRRLACYPRAYRSKSAKISGHTRTPSGSSPLPTRLT